MLETTAAFPTRPDQLLKPFSKPMDEKKWIELFEKMDIKIDYQLNIEPLTDSNAKS